MIVLPDGSKSVIPKWMTKPDAAAIGCSEHPSVSMLALKEAVELLDVMFGIGHGEDQTIAEGSSNDEGKRMPGGAVHRVRDGSADSRDNAGRNDSKDRRTSGRTASEARGDTPRSAIERR